MPPAAAVHPADSRKGRSVDDQVFDALARRLAGARSRRQAIATLGGGALTAALVGLGRQDVAAQVDAAAQCRAHLERCQDVTECCAFDSDRRIECSRVSRRCDRNALDRHRCVGGRGYKCGDDCDCAKGCLCRGNRCRC
jgi:hypothetical protein